jgi:hypothetical protein
MTVAITLIDELKALDDGRKELKVYIGIKQLFNCCMDGEEIWAHSEADFLAALIDQQRHCENLSSFVGTERFLITTKNNSYTARMIGQLGKAAIETYFMARRRGAKPKTPNKFSNRCEGVFFRTLLETQSHCSLLDHLNTLDDGRKEVKVFVGVKELFNNSCSHGEEELFVQTLLETQSGCVHQSFFVGVERFLVATSHHYSSRAQMNTR